MHFFKWSFPFKLNNSIPESKTPILPTRLGPCSCLSAVHTECIPGLCGCPSRAPLPRSSFRENSCPSTQPSHTPPSLPTGRGSAEHAKLQLPRTGYEGHSFFDYLLLTIHSKTQGLKITTATHYFSQVCGLTRQPVVSPGLWSDKTGAGTSMASVHQSGIVEGVARKLEPLGGQPDCFAW